MGKLIKGIFGGSSSSSESGNRNLQAVNAAAAPAIQRGNDAGDMLAAMLGFGGDPAAAGQATDRLANSLGANFIRDQGSQAITNNAAAKGLLGSGGTLRRLTQFGQQSGSTFLGGLMDRIAQQQANGTQNLGIMSNAGQYSTSQSETKPGMGGFLGAALTGGASLVPGLAKAAGGAMMKMGNLNVPNINIPKFTMPRI